MNDDWTWVVVQLRIRTGMTLDVVKVAEFDRPRDCFEWINKQPANQNYTIWQVLKGGEKSAY